MATIPIEITIQDQASPITPTPSTNTETNITVPDTGAGTIGNNTFSSSSVASIIVPVVLLVLALATVCTLLIHRHKHQGTKAIKREKLAASASATIAVLAATALIGNLALPATKAATSDAEVSIEVPDKISIVVNREDDTTEATTGATAYITSTATFGYKVLLSMAEGVETSNLYLGGDTTSEYYIAPVEEGTLEANTWGYMLSDEEAYSAVPLVDDAALALKGYNNVVDKETTIDYGVRVDKDLPAGTYMGEIEYVTGNAIEYMQDFATLTTEEKSSVLTSMAEDQQYYLKDNRDDKTYRIAKLKDGNIWMTQNLDLQKEDLLEGVSIDNNNTDNPIASFMLPNSQTSGDESWGDSDDEAAVNTAHIYSIVDEGQKYYPCIEYTPWGGCATYSTEEIPYLELGNYYNWRAATAGTGSYDMDSRESAIGSVCPAGWKLPSSSMEPSTATDFSSLLYAYNILASPTSSNYNSDRIPSLFTSPVHLIMAGGYGGGGIGNIGDFGSFWASMSASNNREARLFQIRYNSINPWTGNQKVYGYSVRCLAR